MKCFRIQFNLILLYHRKTIVKATDFDLYSYYLSYFALLSYILRPIYCKFCKPIDKSPAAKLPEPTNLLEFSQLSLNWAQS